MQKTQQLTMDQRTHVIPLGGDEPIHFASPECWCLPLPQEDGKIFIHNARDGRERLERQGRADNGKPWCLVYEDTATRLNELSALENRVSVAMDNPTEINRTELRLTFEKTRNRLTP